MYGKKFMGVKRTTILVGKNQKIIKIWNNVKVKDHVKNVFEFIKYLVNVIFDLIKTVILHLILSYHLDRGLSHFYNFVEE